MHLIFFKYKKKHLFILRSPSVIINDWGVTQSLLIYLHVFQNDVRKEIERRKMGKQNQEFKKKQDQEKTKQLLEERNREKADEKAARERVKQQIAMVIWSFSCLKFEGCCHCMKFLFLTWGNCGCCRTEQRELPVMPRYVRMRRMPSRTFYRPSRPRGRR